jgi:hypothetical protein
MARSPIDFRFSISPSSSSHLAPSVSRLTSHVSRLASRVSRLASNTADLHALFEAGDFVRALGDEFLTNEAFVAGIGNGAHDGGIV